MIVEDQYGEVEWTRKNKKKYMEMGYNFTSYGGTFFVKAEELPVSSTCVLRVVCDVCGKEYEMRCSCYHQAIRKKGKLICQKCAAKISSEKTLESRSSEHYNLFLSYCKERDYIPVSVQSEIINCESEIKYICKKHGERTITINGIKRGTGCYWCGRETATEKRVITTLPDRQDSLYNRATKIANEKGYTILSDKSSIERNTSYIEYLCPEHGTKTMRVSNFINGKGCPECAFDAASKRYAMDRRDVYQRIKKCGGELLNPEDYKNSSEKNLEIRCPKCGTPFITSLKIFEQHGGQVCPSCFNKESTGERMVREFLENNNVRFEQERWFRDCRDVHPLPFDFYLPDFNTCIEFDGRQHFEETPGFSHPLKITQAHDKIKNDYCRRNGIGLVRIPYKKINHIKDILTEELNLHKDMI